MDNLTIWMLDYYYSKHRGNLINDSLETVHNILVAEAENLSDNLENDRIFLSACEAITRISKNR